MGSWGQGGLGIDATLGTIIAGIGVAVVELEGGGRGWACIVIAGTAGVSAGVDAMGMGGAGVGGDVGATILGFGLGLP